MYVEQVWDGEQWCVVRREIVTFDRQYSITGRHVVWSQLPCTVVPVAKHLLIPHCVCCAFVALVHGGEWLYYASVYLAHGGAW